MKNLNIKQLIKKLDGKVRYIDEEGFVRKPRNELGLLFLSIDIFFIYILETFPSELDILVLFFLAYLPYLAIKYYSSHDIETWKHSRHARLWIYIVCFIAVFFFPYYAGILVGMIAYYYLKRKERKYLAEHGTKLASNKAELYRNETPNEEGENEYNKWIKRAGVVAGGFYTFFVLSYGLQYYFESGLILVFIREVLMLLIGAILILLGLFPDYLDAKLSLLIDIKSRYPQIVVNLIIILFILEGIASQPPGGWTDFVQNSYAPEVGMEAINKSSQEVTENIIETAPQNTEAMFRSNLQHTGVYETIGVPQFSKVKWKFETGKSPILGDVLTPHSVSSPAIVDNVVYFGSEDFHLYALDAETGQEKWKFRTEEWVLSSPAITNGVIYFGSEDGYLYAVDSKTGQKKWKFKTENWIDGSPATANGVVYFGSDDGHLYAVDANMGQEKWRFKTDSGMSSSPAIKDSVVYFGSGSGYLFAVNMTTGQEIWKFKAGSSIGGSSPAISDGVVYIGSYSGFLFDLLLSSGYLYAVDAKTGQKIWKFRTGAAVDSSPAIYNGMIYFGSAGGNLYAVDAMTGKEIWKFRTRAGVQSSPAVADGVVYFGSKNGYFYAVDSKTGKGKWKFKTGGMVDSSPAIADGVIYFGSTDRNFYALR